MKVKMLMLGFLSLFFSCNKTPLMEEESLIFQCNPNVQDSVLFIGAMEGKEYCLTYDDGYREKFQVSSTFYTSSSSTSSEIDSEGIQVSRVWSLTRSEDGYGKHSISLYSPSFEDLESVNSFLKRNLKKGSLDIKSENSFVLYFEYGYPIAGQGRLAESYFEGQCPEHFLEIVDISKTNHEDGTIEFNVEFDFLVNTFEGSSKHGFFGEWSGNFRTNFFLEI